MGPAIFGPLELGILATFCPDWEFLKIHNFETFL
jgi:hypothetical protein